MDSGIEWIKFYDLIRDDDRLNPSHLSLLMALYYQWERNNFRSPFSISRRTLMSLAKMNANATYHKYISELVAFKYIDYTPSFHPGVGSLVSIRKGN